MAFPAPTTLETLVEQPRLNEAEMTAKITAALGNADAVKQNYRGGGLYSFYIEGRTDQLTAEKIVGQLKTDGYQVHRFEGQTGYMPPPYMHDFAAAGQDTPDVVGYPQFHWTHLQVSAAKVI